MKDHVEERESQCGASAWRRFSPVILESCEKLGLLFYLVIDCIKALERIFCSFRFSSTEVR